MDFTSTITNWYLHNKRDLPWRNTQNPYLIWLSEIMLQQTRVAQGLPYFISFSTHFPTVFDLANAPEEQVLKLWQGLGYYSRARNLHKTAQFIAGDLQGVFPKNYADLLLLKGVGTYTAAAIASFSYNEAVPVVDGNVFRVLSRYFDIENDISLASTKNVFFSLANELLLKKNPALFNQAIMEFGALQCVPKNPECGSCVLHFGCLALQKKKVAFLPFKSKKLKITKRYFNYLIYKDEKEQTILQKRIEKGIWQNLYEFPVIESEKVESFEYISTKLQEKTSVSNTILTITELNSKSILHKLSHQHLYITFWQVKVEGTMQNATGFPEILKFPFPVVIFNFIENGF